MCRSAKEFFLLMERDLNELPNAYIDREGLSVKLGLAKAVPVFYMLDNGKYISHEPLRIGKNEERDELPITHASVDVSEVDLGQMSLEEEKEMTFIIKNVGENPLKISHIEMSCDCIDVIYGDRIVECKDTIHLSSCGNFMETV